MPRESYASLQAKIEKEISKLQKKAQALQARRRQPVIASIVKSMREYEISPEEITAAYASANTAGRRSNGPRKKAASSAAAAKRPVAPKYRHPKTGETWSGRGKPPRWLAAEEAAGVERSAFLIQD